MIINSCILDKLNTNLHFGFLRKIDVLLWCCDLCCKHIEGNNA
jgi:hypothetical protein